jgi:hypothetical protein
MFLIGLERVEKRSRTWLQALKCFGLQMWKTRLLGEIALAFCVHGVASVRRNTLCKMQGIKVKLVLARDSS